MLGLPSQAFKGVCFFFPFSHFLPLSALLPRDQHPNPDFLAIPGSPTAAPLPPEVGVLKEKLQGEGDGGGMNWEFGIEIYTLLCIK